MKFVMHRDRVIASTSGHAVSFKKGVPTHVPPGMHQDVIAAGGVPEGEIEAPESKMPVEPTDPAERAKLIAEALEQITLRGKREDFTAAGAPHAKVVSDMLGFTVNNKERDAAWVAFQAKDDE